MISILLASYNGEQFIADQIRSILSQTVQDFKLYINDDASTDGTWQIISDFAEEHPEKIFISQSDKNSGGAKHNFLKMMVEIKDDYVMLCDQDDVWLSDKIEKTFAKIVEMEREYGAETPLLAHTDLSIVNENLEIISPSYRVVMNADFSRTSLRNMISQTTVAGCAVMYNRALADKIRSAPDFTVMHDWWLLLTASAFGKIGFIEDQTILYRQHSNNEVGAGDMRTLRFKFHKLLRNSEIKKALCETYIQAACFLEVYNDKLLSEQIKLLQRYSNIPNKCCKVARMAEVCRLGSLKNGFSRKIAHLMYI